MVTERDPGRARARQRAGRTCARSTADAALAALAVLAVLAVPVATAAAELPVADDPAALRVVRAGSTPGELVVAVPVVLSGRTVPPGAFTATADGAPVAVRTERLDPAALDLAIVISPSGDRLTDATARAATVELLTARPTGARIAVVSGTPPTVLTDLGADDAAASAALARTTGTDPAAALQLAAATIPPTRRGVVVAVGADLPTIDAPLADWPPHVSLDVVRIDQSADGAPARRNPTGGFTVDRRSDQLVAALDAVLADLRSQYRVEIDAPASAARLELSLDFADARSTLLLAPAPTAASFPSAEAAGPSVAKVATTPVATGVDDARGWWQLLLASALLIAIAIVATLMLSRGERRRTSARPAVLQPEDPPPAEPARAAPDPVVETPMVVLAGEHFASMRNLLPARTLTLVSSPAEALRAALLDPTAVIVVPEGTTGADVLVRAAANHDRASGRRTRVVSLTSTGALIDLTDGAVARSH